MTKAVFGEPVTATDVERLPPDEGAITFVRLCGSLIAAAFADRVGSFTLPEISQRVNVPDGGVDASYTAPAVLELEETGGLVGPGTTIYQFKYRDATAGTRGALLNGMVQRLREDLTRAAPAADRYVLVTNLDPSSERRRRLREALIALPPLASKVVVVWGAAEIAHALNATPRLRHLFSRSGLCTPGTAESELGAAYERVGWPAFVGREDERRMIESFADDPEAKYLEVVGPRYSGRTRLVIEGLKKRGASVRLGLGAGGRTRDVYRDLDSHQSPGILVVDGCTPTALPAIRDRALARQRLKTIVVCTGGGRQG